MESLAFQNKAVDSPAAVGEKKIHLSKSFVELHLFHQKKKGEAVYVQHIKEWRRHKQESKALDLK